MTTVLVNHRVADYDAWRPEFDRAMGAEWTSDVRSYQVWRGQDDPTLVVVTNTFDSREAAEEFANSSACGRQWAAPVSSNRRCRSIISMRSPPGHADAEPTTATRN